jgi:hypothetical protein
MVVVITCTTQWSVDGNVAIAFSAMMAILAPNANSIIPMVRYLVIQNQKQLVMVIVMTCITITQQSADGKAVIVSKGIWCCNLKKTDLVKLVARLLVDKSQKQSNGP